MDKKNALGTVIKKLRTEKNLSQKELANLMFIDRASIAMFETGKRIPSDDLCSQLSILLDFDFFTCRKNIIHFKTYEHYLLANELETFIESNEILKIEEILKNNQLIQEFTYGRAKQLRTYCETAVLIIIHQNMEEAYHNCILFFDMDIQNIASYPIQLNMYQHYYSMFLNLGYCLFNKMLFEEAISLYNQLLHFLENLLFHSKIPFTNIDFSYKKYYIVCLNNLTDLYFSRNAYAAALDACNKGIEKSAELNILKTLPFLLKLKVEILYQLENYDSAKQIYMHFVSNCELLNMDLFLQKTKVTFEKEYPLLF